MLFKRGQHSPDAPDFMNIHAPSEEVRERFKCLEWIGKRWTKDGKTFIKAKHKTLNSKFYYCFEDDFAWFPDK